MGQRLVALSAADRTFRLVAALDAASHPHAGSDAGLLAGIGSLGVKVADRLEAEADVLIDFSVPAAARSILDVCSERRLPLVIATTGITAEHADAIRRAAAALPIVWSPSMSPAVNLTMKLAEIAGRALRDSDADVEIIERHHRFKEDAPSGTALKFGEIIAGQMGQTESRHGRHGRPGARAHGEIGYHAVRTGDNPGEHTILFGMLGETIELTVRASNRDAYAHGALAAAKFLAGKPPGLYAMADVLGLG